MEVDMTELRQNQTVLPDMQRSTKKLLWKFGDLQLIDLSATHRFLWVCDQLATETVWFLINKHFPRYSNLNTLNTTGGAGGRSLLPLHPQRHKLPAEV